VSPQRLHRHAITRLPIKGWRRGTVGAAFVLLIATNAWPQFSARGRSPKPATKSASAPRSSSDIPARSSPQDRDQVLITRYRELIITQPGEEVPLKRLAELSRKKDGSLDPLLSEIADATAQQSDPYAHLVAWGGLLMEDGQVTEAATKLKSATALLKNRPEAYLLLAQAQSKLGNKNAARESYKKAAELSTGLERSLIIRALRDLSLDLGDLAEAKKYHQDLVRGAPGNLFLLGELGRQLLTRGQTEAAIQELSEVVKMAEGDPRSLAPALRDLGQAQLSARQYEEAIKTLARASKHARGSPGLQNMIDTVAADAHRGNGSLPSFLEELAAGAQSAPRLGLAGQLYEEQGQTNAAVATYERALQMDPRNLDLRLKLVGLLELSGNLDEALDHYAALVQSSPDDVQLSLRYMEMLLAQGHRQKVLNEFDRIARKVQNDTEATLALLDFSERLGEAPRSKTLLDRLSRSRSSDPHFLVELGSRYYRKGDGEGAKKVWRRILDTQTDKKKALLLYGEVLIDHEDEQEGLKLLAEAVKLAPRDARARQALALALERSASQSTGTARAKKEAEALSHWILLLGIDPAPNRDDARVLSSATQQSQARRHIVRLWKKSGSLDEHLPALRVKLSKKEPDLESGRLLAEAYLSLKRLDDAIATLELVVKNAPGDRESLLTLENTYRKLGQYDHVSTTLERLLRSDPARSREYYERLAKNASTMNDPLAALKYAEVAAVQNPHDPQAQAQLGDLYLSQGRKREAEVAYRLALKQDDRQAQVSLKLAELVAQSGRNLEALELLFFVVRTSRDPAQVQKAARDALGLSLPVGEIRRVEDVLRPLAISRPEESIYRSLLLEVLTAEMYPLLQRRAHGTATQVAGTMQALSELAERSTGPLLSALSGDDPREHALAIQLLGHSQNPAAASALVAFAEGAAPLSQRVAAILAIGDPSSALVRTRLEELIIRDEQVQEGPIAQAALFTIASTESASAPDSLFKSLKEGSGSIRTLAALGLAGELSSTEKRARTTVEALLEAAEYNGSGANAQAAALLALSRTQAKLSQIYSPRFATLLADRGEGFQKVVAQASLIAAARLLPDAVALPVLAEALNATDPEVRTTADLAARILASRDLAGAPQTSLLPASVTLQTLSSDKQITEALLPRHHLQLPTEWNDRALAALALGKLADHFTEEARFTLRSSRPAALASLEQLSSGSDAFVGRFLTEDRHSSNDKGQAEATQTAERVRRQLLPEIKLLCRSPHPDLSVRALALLKAEDGGEALALLEGALAHPSRNIHEVALRTLSQGSSPEVLEALSRYEQRAKGWARRRRLASAIGALAASARSSGDKAKAQQILLRLAKDESPLVAEEARQYLGSSRRHVP